MFKSNFPVNRVYILKLPFRFGTFLSAVFLFQGTTVKSFLERLLKYPGTMSKHWMWYHDLKEIHQRSASLNMFILQDQTVSLKVRRCNIQSHCLPNNGRLHFQGQLILQSVGDHSRVTLNMNFQSRAGTGQACAVLEDIKLFCSCLCIQLQSGLPVQPYGRDEKSHKHG